MKKIVAFVTCLVLPATALAGDWYAFLEGGFGWSFDRSNQDEVEFGDEPGGNLAIGGGRRFRLSEHWLVNAEGQLIGQVIPLHGRNDKREASADGRYLWLAGVTVNAWPEYALGERWSLYAGGGLGPGVIGAFGASAATLVAVGGLGVRYRATDALGVDLAGRYYWTLPVRLDGAQSRYDTLGPSFRLLWFF